jgi:folate-binding protein YgfZ
MTATKQLKLAVLDNRGVIRVGGADARALLQGVISNDIDKVSPAHAIWSALLTPQGKYLHDFFVGQIGENLFLDCEKERREDLLKRLKRFKLRSDVSVDSADDLCVAVLFSINAPDLFGEKAAGAAEPIDGGSVFIDPRLFQAGARIITPAPGLPSLAEKYSAAPGDALEYDALRISLGLPDGSRDIGVEKSVLLEAGFDELNGIDWHKGCYMGQEVTARTYHRGLVKRRLMPIRFDGPPAPAATPLLVENQEVGEITSVAGDRGLAMVRLDALDAVGEITANGARVVAMKPDWAKF